MKRCFVTNFDDNYFEYACVLLQSLADNYPKNLDVICIVPEGMASSSEWEDRLNSALKAPNLNVKMRSSKGYESIRDKSNWEERFIQHITEVAMAKVFIASVCEEYDEAVYADADCLFVSDATPLIEHDLYGQAIVAAQEHTTPGTGDWDNKTKAYFNNGVFIADLNYWREHKVEEDIIEWVMSHETGPCIEQTGMNAILYKSWFPLSKNFNYGDSFDPLRGVYDSPTLIHFLGPVKPWTDNPNYDPERGLHDLHWRRVYDKVWGIENFWRPNLDEVDRTPNGIPYDTE